MADGGQTKSDPSGWSTDTLKQHMDELFRKLDKRLDERAEFQQKAVDTAFENLLQRFTGVNEWRQTVTDILNRGMPRAESEAQFKALSDKIDSNEANLEKRLRAAENLLSNLQGRMLVLAGVFGVVVVIVNFALMKMFPN